MKLNYLVIFLGKNLIFYLYNSYEYVTPRVDILPNQMCQFKKNVQLFITKTNLSRQKKEGLFLRLFASCEGGVRATLHTGRCDCHVLISKMAASSLITTLTTALHARDLARQ